MQLHIVRLFLAIYRLLLSPAIHLVAGPSFGCRFVPSCSQYAAEAIQNHGFFRGAILALKRISRCHPLSEAGYDPVPHAIGNTFNTFRKR